MLMKWLVQIVLWQGVMAILLFVPAGTINWTGAWIFLIETFVVSVVLGLWLVMRLLNNSYRFVFAKGCLPGSLDLAEDLLSFSSPDITLGIEIMLGKVLNDRVHQLAHAAEAAGQDRLLAQVSEEAFDQVHPGGTGGSKMQLKARMTR